MEPKVKCKKCGRIKPVPLTQLPEAFECAKCKTIQSSPYLLQGEETIDNRFPLVYPATKKKAVLVGICYKGTDMELEGPVNDVKMMRNLLIKQFNFADYAIITLSEYEKEMSRWPTRANIIRSLKWLVKDCSHGDSLVFYFSGHGVQQEDFTGEEIDGFDEAIVPVDWLKGGMIVDNELNELIVRPLVSGVQLHAIVDAYHSGTILDLPYVLWLAKGNSMWQDQRTPKGTPKRTRGGEAISITGCTNGETALNRKRKSSGLLTRSFVKALEKGKCIMTYGRLLDVITMKIDEYRTKCRIKDGQMPQLASSHPFNVHDKPFYL